MKRGLFNFLVKKPLTWGLRAVGVKKEESAKIADQVEALVEMAQATKGEK